MKITIKELSRGPLRIEISGCENWLGLVCQWFPVPSGQERPGVRGALILSLIEEYILVEGSLNYEPWVSCGRCNGKFRYSVHSSVSRTYSLQPGVVSERELDLRAADLDQFYLKDGALDLAELVNELVQLEIPSVVRHQVGDPACLPLEGKPEGLRVWSSQRGEEEQDSGPFSVLKSLKQPGNQ